MKTIRLGAAIFGHSLCIKRTAKICSGLIAAVFLLQFYCVRELLFAEVVVALGFVVVALIVAVYALGCIAALWLRKLTSRLKDLGALVSAIHRKPYEKTAVTGLSEAKRVTKTDREITLRLRSLNRWSSMAKRSSLRVLMLRGLWLMHDTPED